MSDQSASPEPPSPEKLLENAKKLISRALLVSTARLIHESRHLREATERTNGHVKELKKGTPKKTTKHPPE